MLLKKTRNIINAPIPPELIKTREGGWDRIKKQNVVLSYISGNTVISLMNLAFGAENWDFRIIENWIQDSLDNIYKDNKTSVETITPQPPVAHVRIELVVRTKNEDGESCVVRKEGYGSKIIRGGANDQEHIFKSAATDAFKKAASMLGVGLELYRDENENAYFQEAEYEDPWTNEVYAQYQVSWDYINDFKDRNDAKGEDGNEILSNCIYGFTDELSNSWRSITPENIEDFIEYVKNYDDDIKEE